MSRSTTINLHIERVIIDEAVHRAGPEAVRAALAAQLPALVAERTNPALTRADTAALTRHAISGIAARVPGPSPAARK